MINDIFVNNIIDRTGAEFIMRLVTRSDFDGLACGALLLEAGIIDSWKFAHPKDLQDGLVEINENDCLAGESVKMPMSPSLRAAASGSITTPASSREISLKANIRAKAGSLPPAHALSTIITAEKNASPISMI